MSEPIIKKNPRRKKNEELNKNNPLFTEQQPIAEVEVSDEFKNHQLQTELQMEPQTEPMEKIPRIYIMGGAVVFAIAGLCYFKLCPQPTPLPPEPKPQPKPLPPEPKPKPKPKERIF